MDWLRTIIRFVVAALVLMFIGAIVPGFRTLNFVSALLAAVVIAGISYLIEVVLGRDISPIRPWSGGIPCFRRGNLYYTIYCSGMSVSIIGALLASLIIGLIDLFIPAKISSNQRSNLIPSCLLNYLPKQLGIKNNYLPVKI